jgi:hypothetical protein
MKNPFLGHTYNCDIELFNQLGLKPFTNIEHQNEFSVGEVKKENGTVKVWVQCFPAQFWRFQIQSSECNKIYECKTGSGSLNDFWPFVELILNGMFVIENVSKV